MDNLEVANQRWRTFHARYQLQRPFTISSLWYRSQLTKKRKLSQPNGLTLKTNTAFCQDDTTVKSLRIIEMHFIWFKLSLQTTYICKFSIFDRDSRIDNHRKCMYVKKKNEVKNVSTWELGIFLVACISPIATEL